MTETITAERAGAALLGCRAGAPRKPRKGKHKKGDKAEAPRVVVATSSALDRLVVDAPGLDLQLLLAQEPRP